jgi:hypothetical protein
MFSKTNMTYDEAIFVGAMVIEENEFGDSKDLYCQ